MIKRSVLIAVLSVSVVGCGSQPAVRVPDAQGVEAVSAIGMGCKKPFGLTQHCSGFSGPTKKIVIGDQKVKVSGNEDGTITVMFGPNSSKATSVTNLAYELMKRELVSQGFDILQVTPIESGGIMFGYAIQTAKPNYQVWDAFAVD
jgi:hypothetical protein